MRSARLATLAIVSLMSGPRAASPAPAPAAAPPSETVSADAPRATAAGTTFTVPARWTLRADGAARVLEPPERDIRLAIVDVEAADAADAVKRAWPALVSGFARPLHADFERPGRRGWQAVHVFVYETSPNESHVALAVARRRAGTSWCVSLLDGSVAAQERRGSQLDLVVESLRPAGYTRESFAGRKAHALDAARIKLVTDFVDDARRAARVPGVAIGLVQDGRVVFAGGFGVRARGEPAAVDADTLFLIASDTKALTTLLLSKEVDRGRFTWDTPVTAVYPPFKLGDADTTRQVLMRHLVCACTGLPRQDLESLFEYGRSTPASTMALLGTFTPTTKFGEVFQYSNIMAAAAGFIGGYVLDPGRELGAAYDAAMRREIFGPLGMRATTFDFTRALRANHASPHGEDVDGEVRRMGTSMHRLIRPVRPAGGAWSSARDMARYLQMELANGKLPDGTRIVSEAALLARRAPQVAVGEDRGYGMGLMVSRGTGVTVVDHAGTFLGYQSLMFWVPEANTGGVILTNADTGWLLRGPFERRVLEVLYDGEREAEPDLAAALARHRQLVAVERKRLAIPADGAASAGLAARYRNASLGEVTVGRRGRDTVFDFGEWKSAVATRANDDGTVSFLTIEPGNVGYELVAGARDGKPTLTMRDAQHDYVFVAE
jgi:CubicO group peptidase (beta-lactamase class C family)